MPLPPTRPFAAEEAFNRPPHLVAGYCEEWGFSEDEVENVLHAYRMRDFALFEIALESGFENLGSDEREEYFRLERETIAALP